MSARPAPLARFKAAGLEARWHEVSPDSIDEGPRDKGYQTALGELLDSQGVRVGYIRVSWADEQLIAERMSDPLSFRRMFDGWCLSPADQVEKRWTQVQLYKHVWPVDESTPLEERIRYLEAEAARAAADQAVWYSWASVPTVAYIHLEDHLQGQGLGQELYLWAASQLGKEGKILRASTCQTPQAQASWSRMLADGSLPVKTATVSFPRHAGQKDAPSQEVLILDGRPASPARKSRSRSATKASRSF